ncbi:MAG: hypothetical protein ABII25_07915 [bacterium]
MIRRLINITTMLLIFVGAQFIAPERGNPVFAASNPIGLWHMDESPASDSSTIYDSSGNGNDGTLTTNDGTVNKATAGKVGGALSEINHGGF